MNLIKNITILSFCLIVAACGGSSSGSGPVIEGTLTEAGGAAHNNAVILKHSSGQKIESVTICALGECSVTDELGQWGFAGGELPGGDVLFTLNGHGIETTSKVNIPAGANEVFIDFQHVEGGAVKAEHVTVDGETSHNEDNGHDDEDGHSHAE